MGTQTGRVVMTSSSAGANVVLLLPADRQYRHCQLTFPALVRRVPSGGRTTPISPMIGPLCSKCTAVVAGDECHRAVTFRGCGQATHPCLRIVTWDVQCCELPRAVFAPDCEIQVW